MQGAIKVASTAPESVPLPAPRAPVKAVADTQDKPAPAPLTSGVISSQAIATIPGSAEPMTPVRVRTVQVRMGQTKVASAAPGAPAPVSTSTIPAPRKAEVAETSKAVVAKADIKAEAPAESRAERQADPRSEPWPVAYAQPRNDFPAPLPAQPNTSNGIGQVVIGTPSASATPPAQTLAYADPNPRGTPPTTLGAQAIALQTSSAPQQQPARQPVQQAAAQPVQQPTQTMQHNGAIKAVARSGWIIQVGALESEGEARQRLDAARGSASRLLSDADPFTETVSKGNKTLYRARFAGLNQDSAEAACRTLKRSDISCIAIRN